METFSALLALCVGNSPVTIEFPSQRPVTQSFDVSPQQASYGVSFMRIFQKTDHIFIAQHCNLYV